MCGGGSWSRIVGALILVLLGVIFTLDNLNVLEAQDYIRYWPVLLIAFGIARIVDPSRASGRGFGAIVLVVGVLFMFRNFGAIGWDVWDLWPLILALVGLNILWHALTGRSMVRGRVRHHVRFAIEDRPGGGSAGGAAEAVSTDSTVDVRASFGEAKRVIASQDFRGGKVSVSMGAAEIDLRQAQIGGSEAVLDVRALMGGVVIRVPVAWNVDLRTSAMLGGVEDSTQKPAPGAKTLVITGETVLGGIEVRN